jgi:hypothetical protein
MQSTGSISRGKTAQKHNTRECYRDREHTPDNIDFDRRGDNIVLVNRPIEEVYEACFGAAAEAYNAKQVEKGHAERQIPDYLEHVRKDKKLNEMYEFVVQLGNMEEHPDPEIAAAIYREWLDGFSHRYGAQFCIKQAIIHMDEAVAHMHVEVVPVAESKRGLAVQNSMNKAVKQAGHADYKDMLAGWDEILTEVMKAHGIERVAGDREKQMGGVDINTYKRTKAAEREHEQRLECLQGQIEEMEPLAVTFGESARTLIEHRGDGSKERGLETEESSLESGIGELERQVQEARSRAGELERGNERLAERLRDVRGRHSSLRERFEGLERRLEGVMAGMRSIPDTLSEWAQDMARRLGKRVYSPNSLSAVREQVESASKQLDTGVSHGRQKTEHR